MTLKQMADLVARWVKSHGEETPVYFDCPHCKVAFTQGVASSAVLVVKPDAEAKR